MWKIQPQRVVTGGKQTYKRTLLLHSLPLSNQVSFHLRIHSSSSSIGTATLVGYGLLNYRWVFSAGRFLQSAVSSGTSNPQLGGPVIRTFQLPPPGVAHVWNDASEPQQLKVELLAKNVREFCRKWRIRIHYSYYILYKCSKTVGNFPLHFLKHSEWLSQFNPLKLEEENFD